MKGRFIKMTASTVNPQDAGRAGFSQTHRCPWQPLARGLSLMRQLLAWDTITPFLHTQRMVTGLLGWEKPEFSWNLVHGQAACCLLKPDICDWFCLTGDRERKSRIRNNSYYKQNDSKKKKLKRSLRCKPLLGIRQMVFHDKEPRYFLEIAWNHVIYLFIYLIRLQLKIPSNQIWQCSNSVYSSLTLSSTDGFNSIFIFSV